MCNWRTEKAQPIARKLLRTDPKAYFRAGLWGKGYHEAKQGGHCACCNAPLDPAKLNQAYPHYMCENCYKKIVDLPAERCPLCGKYHSAEQVQLIKRQPREIQHRFCHGDGECLDYWSMIAAIVLGEYQLEIPPVQLQLPPPEPTLFDDEIIDVIPELVRPLMLEDTSTSVLRIDDILGTRSGQGNGSSTGLKAWVDSVKRKSDVDFGFDLPPLRKPEPVPVPVKSAQKTETINGKTYKILEV